MENNAKREECKFPGERCAATMVQRKTKNQFHLEIKYGN